MIKLFLNRKKKPFDLNLVYDGDSQTYRGFYPADLNVHIATHDRYNSLVFYNVAVSGRDSGQILAAQATQVIPKYVAGKKNLISLWCGANDAYHELTDNQIIANLLEYYTTAKNAGFKVMLIGCNSSIYDFGARMIEINTLMYNNRALICDLFINLNDDVRLLDPTDNLIYIDGLHYRELGYQYVADDAWNYGLNNYLKRI